jgi:hypothetical protein
MKITTLFVLLFLIALLLAIDCNAEGKIGGFSN